jgi:hypothetical protein
MTKKAANKSSRRAAPEAAPADLPTMVEVPKPAAGSYDPTRPLSKNTLLQHQVRHFQLLEQTLPRDRRSGHDHRRIVTEGDAAEYLRKMTAMLHPQEAAPTKVSAAPSGPGKDE